MLYPLFLNKTASGAGGGLMALIWIVILFVFMYFIMIRPQQKETKKKNALMNSLAVGDTVLTTSGFYGVVIDIDDDTIIVEFGSNKNCRIPMQKAAIAAVEKPEDAAKEETADKKTK
ncbi:MAG TPA: preprotein translocase subunit YajC [Lachnospiraceae bacterium]|nr:preprotein translocase subunit YajC [Lachnospiraceae bacterium]HAP02757.1 preprotein translocase subunit YajC [Lachnospiraceae bacterium]